MRVNRYIAMAYAAGTAGVYVLLSAMADANIGTFRPYEFTSWWRPVLAVFVGCAAVIPPAIYLGRRQPEECRDCVNSARRYARLETERDELKSALLALEPPK